MESSEDSIIAEQYLGLLEAYMLGDRFLTIPFRRAVNDIMIESILFRELSAGSILFVCK